MCTTNGSFSIVAFSNGNLYSSIKPIQTSCLILSTLPTQTSCPILSTLFNAARSKRNNDIIYPQKIVLPNPQEDRLISVEAR